MKKTCAQENQTLEIISTASNCNNDENFGINDVIAYNENNLSNSKETNAYFEIEEATPSKP